MIRPGLVQAAAASGASSCGFAGPGLRRMMSDWMYICFPLAFVAAVFCALLFVLIIYVKLAVLGVLWVIERIRIWLA